MKSALPFSAIRTPIFSGQFKKILYLLLSFLGSLYASSQVVPTPFPCSNVTYQSISDGTNTTIFSRDLTTGTTATVRTFAYVVSSLSYSPQSNLLFITRQGSSQLVRIGSSGVVTNTITNFVPGNIGGITADGYLVVSSSEAGFNDHYYVIDVNTSRTATFLKLVDPTSSTYPYPAKTAAPYYTNFAGGATINVGDIAFNPSNGLFYGLNNVTAPSGSGEDPNKYKLVTFNFKTGALVYGSTVTGSGIPTETTAFGSAYFDAGGYFYVFANTLGIFYQVNINTNIATQAGTPSTANNLNDGASCPNATLFPSSTLPVVFGKITASVEDKILTVNWETMQEINNSHYDIELSEDGVHFAKIGTTPTKTPGGNASETLNYSFSRSINGVAGGAGILAVLLGTVLASRRRMMAILMMSIGCTAMFYSCTKNAGESLAALNGKYWVRIAQIDKDGTTSYSKTITVVKK
ncbi:hypothetical protein ACTJIJ_21280 [Niabella sp. 22666]|uniref:hypothetical protein n=1 Tax=Niabella sp. 22666 TaxID=3453954 RepID=UPI003F831B77